MKKDPLPGIIAVGILGATAVWGITMIFVLPLLSRMATALESIAKHFSP